MASGDDSREQGVEFGSLADDLEEETYPLCKDELLATYGDCEIGLEDGSQTLREIVEPLGETAFESAEDVERSVIGAVGDDAVGREHYSDRGGAENESDESL